MDDIDVQHDRSEEISAAIRVETDVDADELFNELHGRSGMNGVKILISFVLCRRELNHCKGG